MLPGTSAAAAAAVFFAGASISSWFTAVPARPPVEPAIPQADFRAEVARQLLCEPCVCLETPCFAQGLAWALGGLLLGLVIGSTCASCCGLVVAYVTCSRRRVTFRDDAYPRLHASEGRGIAWR